MEIEVEDKVTRTVTVAPCIKCGDDNANIFDYGYNAPNIGGGKCSKCHHEATAPCDIFPEKEDLVAIWNAQNCKETLIKSKQLQITKLQSEIDALQQ